MRSKKRMTMPKKVTINGREFSVDTLSIESAYSKYANPSGEGFAIYHHFTYPGQSGRAYLEGADTLEELTAKYPGVPMGGCSYIDPDTTMPTGSPSDYEEPWDEDGY